jgi:glutamine amidotransferase
MFKKIGVKAMLSSGPAEIKSADKLVLPGVGAFDTGMQNIRQLGLIPLLEEKVMEQKTPILGICLGMQLLGQESQEGQLAGLGWLDAHTVQFKFESPPALRIPHMGWNSIEACQPYPLIEKLYDHARFYFVHSYHLVCRNDADVLAWTSYGYPFASIVRRQNVMGVQFHPEKSHKYGMQLLRNFAEFC